MRYFSYRQEEERDHWSRLCVGDLAVYSLCGEWAEFRDRNQQEVMVKSRRGTCWLEEFGGGDPMAVLLQRGCSGNWSHLSGLEAQGPWLGLLCKTFPASMILGISLLYAKSLKPLYCYTC